MPVTRMKGTAALAFNSQKKPWLTSESTELKTAAMHQYQGDCVNTDLPSTLLSRKQSSLLKLPRAGSDIPTLESSNFLS